MGWIVVIAVGAVMVLVIVVIARTGQRDRGAASGQQDGSATIAPRSLRTATVALAPSAVELLQIIERLRSAGAQWSEILPAFNPSGNAAVQRALIALRGPHQFIPHVGLNVLEEGCRRALAKNAHAGQLDALNEALRSTSIVVDFGN